MIANVKYSFFSEDSLIYFISVEYICIPSVSVIIKHLMRILIDLFYLQILVSFDGVESELAVFYDIFISTQLYIMCDRGQGVPLGL